MDVDPTAEDELFGHTVHAPPFGRYNPALQTQFVMDVDPRADEAPVGHAVHALAPAVTAYAPAGHKTHTVELLAPAVPEYAPAGHATHAAEEFAAVSDEYVPATQFTHALAPAAAYLPGGHTVQAPPFTPLYPVSHTQLLSNPLAAGEREFAGHRLQFALPSGDHCPSGHGRHVSFPTAP